MKHLRAIQIFLLASVLILCISFVSSATVDRPTLYSNDTKYSIDEYPPELVDGKVFVPINFFIGFKNIQYEYSNNPIGFYFRNSRTGRYFSYSSSSTFIVVDGEFTDVSFPVMNSTIYMPLDYCAEILSLGLEYKSDGNVMRVRVTDGTEKLPFDELIELYDPTEKPVEPPITEPEQPIVRPEIPPVTEPDPPAPENRYVYLTFKADGKGETDSIMKLLNEQGYKATFFFDSQSIKDSPQTVIGAFVSEQSIGILADDEEALKETNNVLYDVLYCYTRIARTEGTLTKEKIESLTDSGYVISTVDIDSRNQEQKSAKDVARSIYNKTFEKTVSVISIDAGEQGLDVTKQLLYYLSADEYATLLPISAVFENQEVKNG